MKSLTIHNMEIELYEAIRLRSQQNSRSMNQEIKDTLARQFLNMKSDSNDFSRFLNLWNDKDLSDFEERTKELRNTIGGDWH